MNFLSFTKSLVSILPLNPFLESHVQEMNLLVEADQPGNQLDGYISRLNTILSQKAAGILQLQNRLAHFQKRLREHNVLVSSTGYWPLTSSKYWPFFYRPHLWVLHLCHPTGLDWRWEVYPFTAFWELYREELWMITELYICSCCRFLHSIKLLYWICCRRWHTM